MSIFYLDHNPQLAAIMMCDTHVNKMIVESAQLLSTAWHHTLDEDDARVRLHVEPARFIDSTAKRPYIEENESPSSYFTLHGLRIYRPTRRVHPCAEWVSATRGNYEWLRRHALALCDEYEMRYSRKHRTLPVLWALEIVPPAVPDEPQTQPDPCMPDACMVLDETGEYYDSVASYRSYYATKSRIMRYTKRPPPDWLEVEFIQQGDVQQSIDYSSYAAG